MIVDISPVGSSGNACFCDRVCLQDHQDLEEMRLHRWKERALVHLCEEEAQFWCQAEKGEDRLCLVCLLKYLRDTKSFSLAIWCKAADLLPLCLYLCSLCTLANKATTTKYKFPVLSHPQVTISDNFSLFWGVGWSYNSYEKLIGGDAGSSKEAGCLGSLWPVF